jgi:putative endonuclease
MFAGITSQLRDWLRAPTLGQRGERAATKFLKRKGYIIVARAARDKTGELDIVAVDRDRTIVFVEVKTRESHVAGHPLEAVDEQKQRRLTRLALRYLKRHDLLECRYRFDVVAITWPADSRRPVIEHFIGAFEPTDQGQFFS